MKPGTFSTKLLYSCAAILAIEPAFADSSNSADGASASVQAPAAAALHEYINQANPAAQAAGSTVTVNGQTITNASKLSPPDNSVESFFQIGAVKDGSCHDSLMQPPTVTTPAQMKQASRAHNFYRFVWHVMDNMGIPMFWGQDHRDIDPSIHTTYQIPSPKLRAESSEARAMENLNPAATQSAQQQIPERDSPGTVNAPADSHQIPESELEGVHLPTPAEDPNAIRP